MRFCKHKTNGMCGENKLLPDVRRKAGWTTMICDKCKKRCLFYQIQVSIKDGKIDVEKISLECQQKQRLEKWRIHK